MSNQEISYSTRSKIYDFLEKEFLNADEPTFKLIANHYYQNYGYGAGNYLIKTYYSWKRGWTKISYVTFSRIIECMPKYLSEDKRFFILKEEIHSFFDRKKADFKKGHLNLADISQSFANFQKTMGDFGQDDLRWFIGKNLFSEEQVDHYLKICRYVLNEKIIQAYRQVTCDIAMISKKLSKINEPINNISYYISFFDQTIYLNGIAKAQISFSPLPSIKFEIDQSMKKYGETYFLDELLKISFEDKIKQTKAVIRNSDIDMFLNHFFDLKKQGQNQVSMKSTFEGEGGILSLHLEFVPYSISKHLIYIASLKLLSYLFLSILIILTISSFLDYWVILAIAGAIIELAFIIPQIKKEIKNIQLAKNNIAKYGQQ